MAVTSIHPYIKQQIAYDYVAKDGTIAYLARKYDTSPRTIGRVLKEFDLATPEEKQKAEANKVMTTLKEFNTAPDTLPLILKHWKETRHVPVSKSRSLLPALLRPFGRKQESYAG